MSLNSARDEALSQNSEVGRKLPSYSATEIRPLHWEVTRHGTLLNDETQSTQSFSTGRKTTDWFTFSSKGTGTGTTVPRPVEVYLSEKMLSY